MNEMTCVWPAEATLGEGPLWVGREDAVYWVDIVKRHVHRLGLGDGTRQTWSLAEAVTSLAVRRQGGFVGTTRHGFAAIDLEQGAIDPIVTVEAHLPGNRFNDGKVDDYGRYWAGTMDDAGVKATGSLYCLDTNLTANNLDGNYIISNGPAFNVDGDILYHTDTVRRVIYAFDFSLQGELSNKRTFVQLHDEAEGKPDGMTVDSEGCIWLCHFGGARLTRFSPEGAVLQVVPMPVPNVTSCTFAGPRLDTLFITTARLNMSEQAIADKPLAGGLFSFKPGVIGLPTPLFAG